MTIAFVLDAARRAPRIMGRGLIGIYRYTLAALVGNECQCPRGERVVKFDSGMRCMPAIGVIGGSSNDARVPSIDVGNPQATTPSVGQCSGGRLGTPPNCYCPQGKVWAGRSCIIVAVRPSEPAQVMCPAGMALLANGQCAQVGQPRPDITITPGPTWNPFGGAAGNLGPGRQPTVRNTPATTSGGGMGKVQPGATPTTGTALVPTNPGVLRQGSGAANALRDALQPQPRCPPRLTGPNCDQPIVK